MHASVYTMVQNPVSLNSRQEDFSRYFLSISSNTSFGLWW